MIKRSLNISLTTLLICAGGTVASLASLTALAGSASPVRTAQQLPANSRVVYVNPILGADTPTSGRENFPYRTIAYALEQATDNTVIQLAPGSYTRDTGEVFPLTIPPGVIVRGDEPNNGGTSVIIGSGSLVSPSFAGQNVTIVMLDDSQLRGVTVTNPNSRGTGVWVESTNPTIRNNTFSNSLREGVFVTGTGNPTIESNVFIQNDANGISVVRQSSGKIRNNEFQNTGFAIAVGDTSTPLIEGNQIVENVDGVVASNRARPILRRNVIRNNSRDGVVAIAEAMPNLGTADDPGENIIVNNGRYAINNSTRNNVLLAVGNQVDSEQIAGEVEFVARVVGFPDVQGHWAQEYIEALASRGIIGGFPDGTFRPNDPVTRAQFAAIVTKAFEAEPKRPLINFVDVSQSFWAYRAIREAYRSEFMSGYPGQMFRPDEQIPRVQVLVSLASGLGFDEGNANALNKYSDSGLIPDWAKASVAAATERSIVVNYPDINQLSPNEVATRADVAAFVYQALVSTGEAEAISSPYAVTYP
ncbi:MAG: DUF1565 domain-containing protein [Elainellaceae cyanobacterium]